MSIDKYTIYRCDVCESEVYENDLSPVKFTRRDTFNRSGDYFIKEEKEFSFDACINCFKGNDKVRGVFRKILGKLKELRDEY